MAFLSYPHPSADFPLEKGGLLTLTLGKICSNTAGMRMNNETSGAGRYEEPV